MLAILLQYHASLYQAIPYIHCDTQPSAAQLLYPGPLYAGISLTFTLHYDGSVDLIIHYILSPPLRLPHPLFPTLHRTCPHTLPTPFY